MASGHTILILVGYLINFYGRCNCQISSSCQEVKCEIENNGKFKTCTINSDPSVWISKATPVKQKPSMDCKEGKTFGRAGNKIWVTYSCQGLFHICSNTMSHYGIGKCFTPFECNGKETGKCVVGEKHRYITGAELREEHGSSNCKTWSRNGNVLYVDKKCNGVFTICYANESDTERTWIRSWVNCHHGTCKLNAAAMIVEIEINPVHKEQEECKEVRLENGASNIVNIDVCDANISLHYIPGRYTFSCNSDLNTNVTCNQERTIPAGLAIQKEVSKGRCFYGSTYGYIIDKNDAPKVWVADGCRAVFQAFPQVY